MEIAMARKSLLGNLATAFLVAAVTIGSVSIANAVAVTYDVYLNTPLGAPMTDIVLYAQGEGQEDLYISPVTLPGTGHSQLTHDVDFQPTAAFVLGLSYAGISSRRGDARYHLMMFTNPAFAADVIARGERLDDVFDVANEGVPVGFLKAVHANPGDTVNLGLLTDFIHSPESTDAYFDPDGSFRIVAWSIPQPGGLPEPTTLALLALGVAGLVASRRRKLN
jgi:hypothetical protein